MRINTRFPMAVHALSLIALNKDEELPSTSELIAKSAGTNPVVIRRLIAQLKNAGLVHTRPGVAGMKLAKRPEDITLYAIYQAVQTREDNLIFDLHPSPSQKCWVGKNIHSALSGPLCEAQEALEETLKKYTLAAIAEEIAIKAQSDVDSE